MYSYTISPFPTVAFRLRLAMKDSRKVYDTSLNNEICHESRIKNIILQEGDIHQSTSLQFLDGYFSRCVPEMFKIGTRQ